MKTYTLALIGKQLSHSYSKLYFEEKFAALGMNGSRYELMEMPTLDGLRAAVVRHRLDGFNVTIPYKKEIMALLDDIDADAASIGAVNVVRVQQVGDGLLLKGYNTDAPAFRDTLRPLLRSEHIAALVLGTGGAAKAVGWALQTLGIEYKYVSRNPDGRPKTVDYYEACALASTHLIIVNATPKGMFPSCSESPWQRPERITSSHLCYDLVYNPSPTFFLRQAAARGATVCDGLAMLHRQADLAFDLFIPRREGAAGR